MKIKTNVKAGSWGNHNQTSAQVGSALGDRLLEMVRACHQL